mgnify:CR=1 FL=1
MVGGAETEGDWAAKVWGEGEDDDRRRSARKATGSSA